jgi:hypothetical protein
MSRPIKRHALRLLVYLHSAGHTPSLRAANYFELAAALSKEYRELPLEVRKSSRLLGRKLIRAAGLKAAYQAIPNAAPIESQMSTRHKCSTCRGKKLNQPKSIWATQEDAEAFCSYFKRFTSYPCPVGNGWHITHQKRP